MKILKYKLWIGVNQGTAEKPANENVFSDVEMSWSKANEEIAKREAYNGEYTIVDDGQPEPDKPVTTDDVLNTLLGVTV